MILSRERLDRLRHVLTRQDGTETFRQLTRRFGLFPAEIEAAAALGWVEFAIQKPRTGRPSRIVRLSETVAAKLPPWRGQIEKPITHRHWRFALLSVYEAVEGGSRRYGFASYTDAYQKAFHAAVSRKGAEASCSRLIRQDRVFAARQFCYAQLGREIPRELPRPSTASEIWETLKKHDSWRKDLAPLAYRLP